MLKAISRITVVLGLALVGTGVLLELAGRDQIGTTMQRLGFGLLFLTLLAAVIMIGSNRPKAGPTR